MLLTLQSLTNDIVKVKETIIGKIKDLCLSVNVLKD